MKHEKKPKVDKAEKKPSPADKIKELDAKLAEKDERLAEQEARITKLSEEARKGRETVKEYHARALKAKELAEQALAKAGEATALAKQSIADAKAKAEEMVRKMNEKHGALVKKLREHAERLEHENQVKDVSIENMADRLRAFEENAESAMDVDAELEKAQAENAE